MRRFPQLGRTILPGVISLLLIASAAFAATNVDGMVVLLTFFSDCRYRTSEIVRGEYCGIFVLIAAALLCSLLSYMVAPDHIGLIGFVPLGLGVWQAIAAPGRASGAGPDLGRRLRTLTVALITISNGGDNIATYAPLFSSMSGTEIDITIVWFLLLTGLWCAIAYWLVRRPRLSLRVQHYGALVRPYVLMALGALILIRTHALTALFG